MYVLDKNHTLIFFQFIQIYFKVIGIKITIKSNKLNENFKKKIYMNEIVREWGRGVS